MKIDINFIDMIFNTEKICLFRYKKLQTKNKKCLPCDYKNLSFSLFHHLDWVFKIKSKIKYEELYPKSECLKKKT